MLLRARTRDGRRAVGGSQGGRGMEGEGEGKGG